MIKRGGDYKQVKTTTNAYVEAGRVFVDENNVLDVIIENRGSTNGLSVKLMGRFRGGNDIQTSDWHEVFGPDTVAVDSFQRYRLAGGQLRFDEYAFFVKAATDNAHTTYVTFLTSKDVQGITEQGIGDPVVVVGAEAADVIAVVVTTPTGAERVLHFQLVDPTTRAPLAAAAYTLTDGGAGALVAPAVANSYIIMSTASGSADVDVTDVVGASDTDVLLLVRDGYKGQIIAEQTLTFDNA